MALTSLKKPKKPEARVAKPSAPQGGVKAPNPYSKTGTTGLSQNKKAPSPGSLSKNQSLKPSGASGTGSGSQAAPAPSAGSLRAPAPESPATHNARLDSGNTWVAAQQKSAYDKYMKALRYGDLTAANAYGAQYAAMTGQNWAQLNEIPTGELQEIAKAEAANQLQNKLGHNENNTFFSGMNLTDIGNIESGAVNEKTKAKQDFDQAIHEYEEAYNEALEAFEIAQREADERDREAAEKVTPVAQNTDSDNAGAGGGPASRDFQRGGNIGGKGSIGIGGNSEISLKKKK